MTEAANQGEFLARGSGLPPGQGRSPQEAPKAADHELVEISGTPRERGTRYGRLLQKPIAAFLEKELYEAFTAQAPGRDVVLRYAEACGNAIRRYSPAMAEELEGIAEGAGLKFEEIVLITLHEELWHKGVLPTNTKCTAFAAAPPDTRDGHTYVGQNWDWMERLFGLSRMFLWKRPEGPSVLAYGYPGLWVGSGINSAGIALCWTSGKRNDIPGPAVGIPTYVLIAHLLYQESLGAVIAEARRATHAGWFTFVLADGKGNLVNLEGIPGELVVEEAKGHFARVYEGSRRMTRTPEGQEIPFHPQCRRMWELLQGSQGCLDRSTLQGFFGDHQSTICKHFRTLDSILFDCTQREAYVSRGPGCSGRWQTFRFQE